MLHILPLKTMTVQIACSDLGWLVSDMCQINQMIIIQIMEPTKCIKGNIEMVYEGGRQEWEGYSDRSVLL